MNAITTQPLLSVRDAAQLLSISVRTVYALVERGELPAVRVGGSIRFVPSVLETWLTEGGDDRSEEPRGPEA